MAQTKQVVQRMSLTNTALLICDMQEKFRGVISFFPAILEVSKRMLQGAHTLGIPVLATEQYPKGLGRTVPELDLKNSGIPVFPKTSFSMLQDERVHVHLKEQLPHINNVLICGIEAHICVYQTVLDLLENNYRVHVVVDACSSRNPPDRIFGFRQMEKQGALLTTSECALFGLLGNCNSPKFKDIQKIIMDLPPDCGLLQLKV